MTIIILNPIRKFHKIEYFTGDYNFPLIIIIFRYLLIKFSVTN